MPFHATNRHHLSSPAGSLAIRLVALLLLVILVHGCRKAPPLTQVPESDLPLFIDDGDRGRLQTAVQRQRQYLLGLPADYTLTINGHTYPRSRLIHSLDLLLAIVRSTPESLQFNERIRREFMVFQASGRESGKRNTMLVTGYFEPVFAGSTTRHPPYLFPLYSPPPSLVKRSDPATGDTAVGRYNDHGKFVPFWTRCGN